MPSSYTELALPEREHPSSILNPTPVFHSPLSLPPFLPPRLHQPLLRILLFQPPLPPQPQHLPPHNPRTLHPQLHRLPPKLQPLTQNPHFPPSPFLPLNQHPPPAPQLAKLPSNILSKPYPYPFPHPRHPARRLPALVHDRVVAFDPHGYDVRAFVGLEDQSGDAPFEIAHGTARVLVDAAFGEDMQPGVGVGAIGGGGGEEVGGVGGVG